MRRLVGWAGAHLQALGLSLLLVIFAAAAFWFVAFFIPGRRQAAIDGWRRELSLLADFRRDALERRIRDGADGARFISVSSSVRQLIGRIPGEEDGAEIGPERQVLSDFRRHYRQRSVSILDATGRLRASDGGTTPGATALTLAADAIRSGAPSVDLVREPDGVTGLAWAVPVTGDEPGAGGHPRGAVLVVDDASTHLFDLLGQPVPASSSESLLVREDGKSILFLSPLRFRPDSPLTFRIPFATAGLAARAAILGKGDFLAFADYRGTRVFAAVRRLKGAPWGLVVKVDQEEALAAFRKDVFDSGITWGALLVALSAAAFGLWRSLVASNEVELAQSEAKSLAVMHDVIDCSSAPIFIFDLEGRILFCNRKFESLNGITRENIVGQRREIFMPGHLAEQQRKSDLEVMGRLQSIAVEDSYDEPDGQHVYSTVKFPLLDAQGNVYAVAGISTDITAGKQAAEDLAKSEAYFRSLLENSLDLTAVLDPDGCVRYTSPSVERILGYKPEELAGRSAFELIHQEDRKDAEARLRQVLAEGTRMETIEIRFQHRNGSSRTIAVIGKSLLSETGTTGVILNARDVTERLQLEAQFQQAQKMEAVGRLAGGVAHDFNNLLTVIQGYGELLKATFADDSERRENLDEIVKAAERAAGLTRQLLAFSRQQVLEMRVIDLGAVIADIEKMLKRLIGEDIEVGVVKPPALGHVKADPGQIEQVVLNLAVNARDAMPRGGRLLVELGEADLDAPLAAARDAIPAGRYVVISMSDTGSGMDAETLGHIFEPFFTTKEKGKGTGLGLATVYGIVRQTGGYVAVETAPGAGTTFRIYLPRCDERITSGIRPSVLSRRGTETVLLVEDEPAVRALTNLVLERQGYTVLVAENGAAALDVVAGDPRPIHVLLTDIVMPGISGRELASLVAALRPFIKVLFMSGYTAEVLTNLDVKAGRAFISKPFTERGLSVKLREILDAPRPEILSSAAGKAP